MVEVSRSWAEDGGAELSSSCQRVVRQITV
jgi:hypothetical protein